ncbi:hypothetical protein SOVF_149560 [Spinacia oleracea]|nr:hypothetical protein SOVF_149560 [Spinacia oleracea]
MLIGGVVVATLGVGLLITCLPEIKSVWVYQIFMTSIKES